MLYTKEHEWVKDNGNGTYTVGITKYAVSALGDIVFVDKPSSNEVVKDNVVIAIESVKAASDVYGPVTGTIVEFNDELEVSPELVSDDPEGKGWLWIQEADYEEELGSLMTESEYEDYINKE